MVLEAGHCRVYGAQRPRVSSTSGCSHQVSRFPSFEALNSCRLDPCVSLEEVALLHSLFAIVFAESVDDLHALVAERCDDFTAESLPGTQENDVSERCRRRAIRFAD